MIEPGSTSVTGSIRACCVATARSRPTRPSDVGLRKACVPPQRWQKPTTSVATSCTQVETWRMRACWTGATGERTLHKPQRHRCVTGDPEAPGAEGEDWLPADGRGAGPRVRELPCHELIADLVVVAASAHQPGDIPVPAERRTLPRQEGDPRVRLAVCANPDPALVLDQEPAADPAGVRRPAAELVIAGEAEAAAGLRTPPYGAELAGGDRLVRAAEHLPDRLGLQEPGCDPDAPGIGHVGPPRRGISPRELLDHLKEGNSSLAASPKVPWQQDPEQLRIDERVKDRARHRSGTLSLPGLALDDI
jgi:hypothetical protein